MFNVMKKMPACAMLTAFVTLHSATVMSQQAVTLAPDDTVGNWGVSLGIANYSNATVSSAEDLLMLSGTASNTLIAYDNADTGYYVGINYLAKKGYFFEVGYLDQGDIFNLWEDTVASVDEFVAQVRPTLPILGKGTYLRAGKRIFIQDKVFTELHIGTFHFTQEVDSVVEIGNESTVFTQQEKGLAFSGGLALGYKISSNVSVKLSAERYRTKHQNIDSVGINLNYHF